jgi:glycosyltransferase involved in cell wall biosynthesis
MKLHIANFEPNRTGGGWSFCNNLYKGLGDIVTDYTQADYYLIAGATMAQRGEVQQAKADGKKIILRVDNAVRNSRNRNTGMSRMLDFANWADIVIYQSQWAKDYLGEFLKKDGPVILNGVDTDLFKPQPNQDKNCILYSRYNRDDTKNFEVARYWFSREFFKNPELKLLLCGQFSPELSSGEFDFYNNEVYQYLGVLDKETMASVYAMCSKFLYVYYNDCCSNTLIEALVSGCEIVGDKYYQTTGGAKEIMRTFDTLGLEKARKYFSLERMCMEIKELLC